MPDRENVIKEWEAVLNRDPLDAPWDLIDDTLALLKEQEAVVRCKDCRWAEVSDNEHTWCDHVDHEFCHNNDWYCADGQRKE